MLGQDLVLAITKSKGEYRQSVVVKMMNVLKIAGSVGTEEPIQVCGWDYFAEEVMHEGQKWMS